MVFGSVHSQTDLHAIPILERFFLKWQFLNLKITSICFLDAWEKVTQKIMFFQMVKCFFMVMNPIQDQPGKLGGFSPHGCSGEIATLAGTWSLEFARCPS